ncbi:unnamed protein product [Lactuca saligna]|uniref:DUF3741 domain-containing protein n=1 Tax=Lactuca saligna TaxID=75948 RepID=A0AA36EAX3_LACSI|nr:unnamed protein product [Lactuca saligna]
MTNSKDNTPTTCFSSILRHLLCTGGLPTHPSSDTDNPEGSTRLLSRTDLSIKHQPSSPTRSTIPAGIVARLMGLDSIPKSPHTTVMRKSRTSVSFREVPTFLRASHNHGRVDPVRKSEMGLFAIEEKSQNLNKKKKVQTQKQNLKIKSEESLSCGQGKCRIRKKEVVNPAKKKVIDDGFPEEQKKKNCKSRKRTYNHPLPKMGKRDRKAKKKVILKRKESEYSEEYCIKVLMEVCRLTRDETNGRVWIVHNLQDISYEIGQEILQVLVYEMIDELL